MERVADTYPSQTAAVSHRHLNIFYPPRLLISDGTWVVDLPFASSGSNACRSLPPNDGTVNVDVK